MSTLRKDNTVKKNYEFDRTKYQRRIQKEFGSVLNVYVATKKERCKNCVIEHEIQHSPEMKLGYITFTTCNGVSTFLASKICMQN